MIATFSKYLVALILVLAAIFIKLSEVSEHIHMEIV